MREHSTEAKAVERSPSTSVAQNLRAEQSRSLERGQVCEERTSVRELRHALQTGTSVSSPYVARSLLQIQRTYGNRHVQRFLALARQGEGEAEVTPEVESAIERSRSGGQALDTGVRRQMESAFGTDFNGVRIHTGSESHSLNRAVSAIAFTTGRDIFFRDGTYDPSSSGGRELLAHELTHVVQQGGGAVQGKLVVGEPGDSYEQEADLVAKQVVASLQDNTHSQGQALEGAVADPVQRQCACGGHSASGGECEECRSKRESALQLRGVQEIQRSLQRQDDGDGNGDGSYSADGSLGTTGAGGNPCLDRCWSDFNDCKNRPGQDATQCLAQLTACQRGCGSGGGS